VGDLIKLYRFLFVFAMKAIKKINIYFI